MLMQHCFQKTQKKYPSLQISLEIAFTCTKATFVEIFKIHHKIKSLKTELFI